MGLITDFLDAFNHRKYRAVAELEDEYVLGIRENGAMNMAKVELMRKAADRGTERSTVEGWDVIQQQQGIIDEIRNEYLKQIERTRQQNNLGRTYFANSDDLGELQ